MILPSFACLRHFRWRKVHVHAFGPWVRMGMVRERWCECGHPEVEPSPEEFESSEGVWMLIGSGFDGRRHWCEWARIPKGMTGDDWGRTFTRKDTQICRTFDEPTASVN